MKKVFVISVIIFLFLFLLQTVSWAELKIGVVDLYRVLNESEEGKKAIYELQSMLEKRQRELDEKQKKIQSLKEDYDKKKAVLSEEARKSKEEEIERLSRELQRTAADYQMELQKKQNEITQSMLKEIRQIINEYAHKEGYSLIVEKAEQLILYTAAQIDITDKIIAIFNQKTDKSKQK
ncbi:MAG: OmpH family outer membrane protein [Thermodesulfovibrio sp.]|nr:OmpH family outer membrane protein [Thermodesulfovibrio sp.]